MSRIKSRRGVVTTAAVCAAFTAGVGAVLVMQPQKKDPMDAMKDAVKDAAKDAMHDAMGMDPTAVVEMMKAAGQPGPEHEVLKKMAGEWTFEAGFMMDPSAPAEISKGTARAEMALNGMALVSHVDMDFMFMGNELPMKGVDLMIFNRTTGAYESVWVDTLDPYFLVQTGRMEGNTLTLEGKGTGSMGETLMRNRYVFQDADHYTMEFHQPVDPTNPGGEWAKIGTITYTRK